MIRTTPCHLTLYGQTNDIVQVNSLRETIENPVAAFFVHSFSPSGAEYYALECARIAKAAGFQIVWIVDHISKNDDWEKDFLTVSDRVLNVWDSGHIYRDVFSFLSKENPSVVHIHHSLTGYEIAAMLKKKFAAITVIDSTHIIELKNEGFPCLSAQAGDAIDCRNVISNGLKEYYIQCGIPEQNILRSIIVPEVEGQEGVLPSIENNHVNIKIIGRLDEQKRPYLIVALIKRMKRLQQNGAINKDLKLKFSIYGFGEYFESMKSVLFQLSGKHFEIEMITSVYDKNIIYENTFCVVQLSENEGISLVSYEATLRYKYILTTDAGQQGEIMEEEFLLPSRASKAVKAAAERLCNLLKRPESLHDKVISQRRKILSLDEKYGYKNVLHDFYMNRLKEK